MHRWLNRSNSAGLHWVYEKRGTCKARLLTHDRRIVTPTDISDIHSSHTHAPNCSRVEMIKGLNTVKHRASNSDDSTRLILENGLETVTNSTISKLSKICFG